MLRWCVAGTLSYVVIGGTLAIFGALLLCLPVHADRKTEAWTSSTILLSAAQGTSIFALGELAMNVREEISLLRPYGKFLSVKFVVFFAFWQGLLLRGFEAGGMFDAFDEACGSSCAVTVFQNGLICLEMLVASLVHFRVFPPHDYLKLLAQQRLAGQRSPSGLGSPPTITEVVDVRDIFGTALQVKLFSCTSQKA